MAAIRPVGNPLVPGPDDFSAAVEHLGTDEDPSMHPDRALEAFWAEEAERAFAVQAASTADAAEVFKFANDLPLARIKRIMKSDEDVRMISAEAPIVFAKACEMFIADLTVRAYGFSTEDKGHRRTLTREDVLTAILQTDTFDFLVGVLMPGTRPVYPGTAVSQSIGVLGGAALQGDPHGAGGDAGGGAGGGVGATQVRPIGTNSRFVRAPASSTAVVPPPMFPQPPGMGMPHHFLMPPGMLSMPPPPPYFMGGGGMLGRGGLLAGGMVGPDGSSRSLPPLPPGISLEQFQSVMQQFTAQRDGGRGVGVGAGGVAGGAAPANVAMVAAAQLAAQQAALQLAQSQGGPPRPPQ